jgi:hypothetical protein
MLFPNHFSTERLYGWKWLEMVEFILVGTIIDTLLSIKEGKKKSLSKSNSISQLFSNLLSDQTY